MLPNDIDTGVFTDEALTIITSMYQDGVMKGELEYKSAGYPPKQDYVPFINAPKACGFTDERDEKEFSRRFRLADELKAARIVAAIQGCKLEGGLVCEYITKLNDLVVEVDHDPYTRYPYIINDMKFTRGLMDENGNSGWKLAKERDKKGVSMRKRDLPKLRKSKTTGAIVLFTGIETGVELTNYLSNDDSRCRESYIPRDTYLQWQPLSVKETIKALKGQK